MSLLCTLIILIFCKLNRDMSRLTKVLRRHSILPKKSRRVASGGRHHGRRDESMHTMKREQAVVTAANARTVIDQAIAEIKPAGRFDEYYAGKELTRDWTSCNLGSWTKILESRRPKAWRILEIGSLEGRSALFFLNYLPHSTIVCVESFAGSQEHLDTASPYFIPMSAVEGRFDANLAPFGERVEKHKGLSWDVIPQLAFDERRFDLVYVDGDHRATSVFKDAALAWPLLVPSGIMIFDDYLWDPERPPHDRPQMGIDAFLQAMAGRYRELHRQYQVIVEKL